MAEVKIGDRVQIFPKNGKPYYTIISREKDTIWGCEDGTRLYKESLRLYPGGRGYATVTNVLGAGIIFTLTCENDADQLSIVQDFLEEKGFSEQAKEISKIIQKFYDSMNLPKDKSYWVMRDSAYYYMVDDKNVGSLTRPYGYGRYHLFIGEKMIGESYHLVSAKKEIEEKVRKEMGSK